MGIPDYVTCLLRNLMQVKKQQLEMDMEQWTGSKLRKEYIKAVYCHPAYLISMQITSCEMPSWMKHKLKSRLQGEVSATSDMHMIPLLMAESREELKSLLMSVKQESEKAGLKFNIQKTRSWHLALSLHGKWGKTGNSDRLYFLGLQNCCGL